MPLAIRRLPVANILTILAKMPNLAAFFCF